MTRKTKLLALVASLSAANAALRILLGGWLQTGGLPNVKPTIFLTIIAGIISGPIGGFAVGWLTMTLSDFGTPYGPGVWTIETSFCMGVVGLLAGILWQKATDFKRWKLAIGGWLLAMIFDIGTSVMDAILFSYPVIPAILALYVPFITGGFSPYPFGIADELTTAVLLAVLGPKLIRRIGRIHK